MEHTRLLAEREKTKLKVDIDESNEAKNKLEKQYQKEMQSLQEETECQIQKANGKSRLLEANIKGLEAKLQAQVSETEAIKKELQEMGEIYKTAIDKQSTLQTENTKLQTEL